MTGNIRNFRLYSRLFFVSRLRVTSALYNLGGYLHQQLLLCHGALNIDITLNLLRIDITKAWGCKDRGYAYPGVTQWWIYQYWNLRYEILIIVIWRWVSDLGIRGSALEDIFSSLMWLDILLFYVAFCLPLFSLLLPHFCLALLFCSFLMYSNWHLNHKVFLCLSTRQSISFRLCKHHEIWPVWVWLVQCYSFAYSTNFVIGKND